MPVVADQMGRSVNIPEQANKIISLVPSQTEYLFDLGLADEVVGITKFCIHPQQWFHTKTRVGGTKRVDVEIVKRLNPDLIIGNKEENAQSDIEKLAADFPVWMSDICDVDSAIAMMQAIGNITHRQTKAHVITGQIQDAFNQLQRLKPALNKKVLYLIWDKPMMAAGSNTFIDNMLQCMGLQNIVGLLSLSGNTKVSSRYPVIELNDFLSNPPDVIMLSSEPYPFGPKQQQSLQQLFPNAEVVLVDGEMFSWYGSRMLQAPAYFQSLL